MAPFEFLIRKPPVSVQGRNKDRLKEWKSFVRAEAAKTWNCATPPVPVSAPPLRFSIVYLCSDARTAADIDNIIKPIQDALVGLVFADDFLVSDVDSHRRFLTEPIDYADFPELLQTGVIEGKECVYVKVSDAQDLRSYL